MNLDPDGPGGLSPFLVPLEGKPFGTLPDSGSLWNTDTIVERTQERNPFNVDDTGTVDIELVALSQKSVVPVDIGGTLFDIEILSGNLLGEPSNFLGSVTINHSDPNGGTFSSILPVSAKLIFTEVGNFFNTFDQPFNDVFTANGVWLHTPGPMPVIDSQFPARNFHAGVDPLTGEKVLTLEQSALAAHGVVPAMAPEPSSLV